MNSKFLKIVIALLFIAQVNAQYKIKGSLTGLTEKESENYTWAILYKLNNNKQVYISNVTITNNQFVIEMPKDSPVGYYSVVYNRNNNGKIDLIFNNENIEFTINPKNPDTSLVFVVSKENKASQRYSNDIGKIYGTLDSIQESYIDASETTSAYKKKIERLYKKKLKIALAKQKSFEQESENMMTHHVIKGNKRHYPKKLIVDEEALKSYNRANYFNSIDFSNPILHESGFPLLKVMRFVFSSENTSNHNSSYKRNLKEVSNKLTMVNDSIKAGIYEGLLNIVATSKNREMTMHLLENYYSVLPKSVTNKSFIENFKEKVRLAIGGKVPDIKWVEDGKEKQLSTLNKADKYVLVFWSSSCPHCTRQVPELHQFYEQKKLKGKVHVLAYALETDDILFKQYAPKFTGWSNILGLGKWENPIVKDFKVTETPTYIVVDKDLTILETPRSLSILKDYLSK